MRKNRFLITITSFLAIVLSTSIIFFHRFAQIPTGNIEISNSTVSISLSTSQFVSGVSMRLVYDYSKEQKPNIEIQLNKALIDNGWSFPVNKVNLNEANKIVTIDLAAIIPTPTGYFLSGTTDIVTITSKKGTLTPSNFSIDKTETKVINKQGQEISLLFNQ